MSIVCYLFTIWHLYQRTTLGVIETFKHMITLFKEFQGMAWECRLMEYLKLGHKRGLMNVSILKKKWIWIFGALVLICIATIMNRSTSENVNYALDHNILDIVLNPEMGEAVLYGLERKDFQKFLKEPSINFAGNKCYRFFIYKKAVIRDRTGVGFDERPIEVYGFNKDRIDMRRTYSPATVADRIGRWPVNLEFVDFMNDPENIRRILKEYDIEEELKSYVIIEHISPPTLLVLGSETRKMCIWVHTDLGDYFLDHTYNPEFGPLDGDFNNQYTFYTLKEYRKRYG